VHLSVQPCPGLDRIRARQRTELTSAQRDILAQLDIEAPKKIR